MNDIKINEWQEMALKKDVEKIARKVDSSSPVIYSLCWDAALAFSVLLVDHFFDVDPVPQFVWYLAIASALIPPVIIIGKKIYDFIYALYRTKMGRFDFKKHIDTFDNQLCYWAMISNSYIQMLKKLPPDDEMNRIFIYQEACYYNNKCEQALYSMKSVLSKVFSQDEKLVREGKCVAVHRLKSLIQMLAYQNETMDKEIAAFAAKESVVMQQKINQQYLKYYNDVVKDISRLFGE